MSLVRLRLPPEAERRRKAMSRRRAAVLAGVHVLIALHIAHWRFAGRTLAPLELNEVLHTLHLGIVTAGFIFMVLAVLATSVFGRFFCSWGCHLLALQDLCAWLLERVRIRPRPIRSRVLLWAPMAAMLYLFVWPQIERMAAGRAAPALHVATEAEGWASFVTSHFWRNLPGLGITLATFLVCGGAIVYVLGSRSFCRYACPYGALFALADRVAPGRIVLSGDCDACGVCTAVCQSHVRVHEEVRAAGMVVDPGCLRDLDCLSVCPKRALRYAMTRPPILRPRPSIAPPRHDLSLAEDGVLLLVALATLVVLRGLYGAVPFVLALGASLIVGTSAVLCLRMRVLPRVHAGHVDLRRGSRVTPAGKVFLSCVAVVGVLLVHSGVVRWHEVLGERALAGSAAAGREPARADLDAAIAHSEAAATIGLFVPVGLHRRLASLYLLRAQDERALPHLRAVLAADPDDAQARERLTSILASRSDQHLRRARALERDGDLEAALVELRWAVRADPGSAVAHLALGATLARGGSSVEAEGMLVRATEIDPSEPTAWISLAAVRAGLGRNDAAIDAAREAVRLAPDNAAAHANLGLLLVVRGDPEAREHLRRAVQLDPRDHETRAELARLEGL